MRILVHDFGGYAFALQLSRTLAARGHTVCHAWCGSHQTTPPGIDSEAGNGVILRALHLTAPLNKYAFVKRWRQEREYGRLLARLCREFEPQVVLSGNTPLSAQHALQRTSQAPVVYWLQDLIGEATYRILRRRLGPPGLLAGRYFQRVEARLLRQSASVVAISKDFVPRIRRMGVEATRVHVIENWAPLTAGNKSHHVPLAAELARTPCFLYTGTLSMKHNPALLARLAEAVAPQARVVVISQGLGAEWLKEYQQTHALASLTILPYQPMADLAALYAAAAVLVAVLEKDASVFSVPSKVLTYLAAARPLLLAVPSDNLAARIVSRAGAGRVVSPKAPEELARQARMLLKSHKVRAAMGQAARTYAERAFNIGRKADRFEAIFSSVVQ